VDASTRTIAQARAPAWLLALALSLLLVGVSMAITELHPPAESDPIALRWLRILAGHPYRSTCALALLAWSLAPRPRPSALPPAA
jgi:hypothetical protein